MQVTKTKKPSLWLFIKLCLKTILTVFLMGGPVAIYPFLEKEFVYKNNFISLEDFNKLIILINSLPGPSLTQALSFIGYKSHGILGLIVGVTSTILIAPSILILIVYLAYKFIDNNILNSFSKGIIPVVMAYLLTYVVRLVKKDLIKNYNWLLYIAILLITIWGVIIKINIAFIFISLAIFLYFIKLN
jgi:chromate transporter